jgi:ABC-type polysaccharide/polyol phosphate export permease
MSQLKEALQSRDLFVNLTLRELRGRYKRSSLGWAWSMLNPLATMIIFSVVFRFFLKVPVPLGNPSGLKVFAFFLLCGLLPWNLINNGMQGGMVALLGNANLIKKVYFPRELLVASSTSASLYSMVIEMAVLSVALVIAGNFVLPWLPLVLVVMALQAIFVLGIALILSVLNVYFRDTMHLMNIVTQLWFYATPIVYPDSTVPEHAHVGSWTVPVKTLYNLNPMTRFVHVYRAALYDLRFPAIGDLLFITVAAAISVLAGYWVFRRMEPKLAEEL